MITPARLSYVVLAATIVLAGLLHLGAPLLVVLFSYFALRQFYFLTKRKWLALILFGVVVAGIAAAAVFLTRAAVLALPDVADTSIPSASAWAQKRQIELPFTDFESLRQVVIDALGQEANYLRNVLVKRHGLLDVAHLDGHMIASINLHAHSPAYCQK
jgi:hypothetical protein